MPVEFKWYTRFAKIQARNRAVPTLCSEQLGISSITEISSRSTDPLGISLSAFNLKITPQNGPGMSVECAFQGSKVFKHGGPFHNLYTVSSIEAKRIHEYEIPVISWHSISWREFSHHTSNSFLRLALHDCIVPKSGVIQGTSKI